MNIRDIAHRLNLKRSGTAWRGTCPACGYGADAFVLSAGRNGKVLAWCAACQDRKAIVRVLGGDMPIQWPAPPMDAAMRREKAKERALALRRGAEPVTANDPAGLYLARRGLPDLIGNPAQVSRGHTAPEPRVGRLHAMVAAVSDVAGAMVAVHRTFLMADGHKASVNPTRASIGRIWGAAIRLDPVASNSPLIVGEGIETAASAGRLMAYPAWAGISAGNLGKGLLLPPEAKRVVIASDPDKPGRDAARNAWLRWRAEGRAVQIAILDGDGDFNDLLMHREVTHA